MDQHRRIYLDFNASAPLLPEARAALGACHDMAGNPSSVHGEGRRLRAIIEAAREDVAKLVNAGPAQVVFTSGATEANATVMRGGWALAAAAAIEHESVLAPLAAGGTEVVAVPVGADGVIEAGALAGVLADHGSRLDAVLAVQLANNETGVVQPVAALAAIAHGYGWLVHCDAVQAPGRIAVDFNALGADTMTLSAHKIGGPKGIGALIIRDGFELPALITGGGQERRRRAGTENVAGIAGFGAAARVARDRLGDTRRLLTLRDRLEAALLAVTPDAVIFGAGAARLPNTTCIARVGLASEIIIIKLDVAGFAVSAGAACSSGKVATSRVLEAMAVPGSLARSAIRISIGMETTPADIDAFVVAWGEINAGHAPRADCISMQPEMAAASLRRVG